MPRTRCPECDADVVVDPRGRCPEGHLVTPPAVPVASRDQVSEGLAELSALEELMGRSEPETDQGPAPELAATPDPAPDPADAELAHFEDLFSSIAAEDRGAPAAGGEPVAAGPDAAGDELVAAGPDVAAGGPPTPPVTGAVEVASEPVPAADTPQPGAQARIDLANFTASGRRVEASRPGARRWRSRR